jgi:hypothetical protein
MMTNDKEQLLALHNIYETGVRNLNHLSGAPYIIIDFFKHAVPLTLQACSNEHAKVRK